MTKGGHSEKSQNMRKKMVEIVQWSQHFLIVFMLINLFALNIKASETTIDVYKNRDVLATRTIPDLTALKFVHFGEHKNEYFNKLLAAWDNLNFDRTFISRGKSITTINKPFNIFIFCNCIVIDSIF